jgi:hypothetical protein
MHLPTKTLLLVSATTTLALSASAPTTTCQNSQPDRHIPAYGPTQTLYGQCGGESYTGRTKCAPPFVCVKTNDYYSQCLEDPSATKPAGAKQTHYGQCGGKGYEGPTECVRPWSCERQEGNEYYSQCL